MRAFVPFHSVLISREVEGHGLGFPHVGLRRVAEAFGFGSTGSGLTFGVELVYSTTEKAWDGVSPELVGWIVEVK